MKVWRCDALERRNIKCRLMSAHQLAEVTENYSSRNAIRYLQNNEVCVFVAGTGNPFLPQIPQRVYVASRLIQSLKATKVDGVA